MRQDQEFLEVFVRYHRWHYYNGNGGLISDEEFDSYYDKLQELYPASPVLAEVGATPGVSCPINPITL